MQVRELGEFGLIRRIAGSLPLPSSDVVVGIGDDVAVLHTGGEDYLLATCDIQVENVHFIRKNITPFQLGRKVVAINVSDIAAMGGTPQWALVSLALPEETDVGFVDELYRGMQEQMQRAGASIVGGNLSGIRNDMLIDFFLLGRVHPENLVLRRGAQEGDSVLVTGTLGDSRAGLELLRRPDLEVAVEERESALARHLTPQPRLSEGQVLGRLRQVHAMADVSDGLLSDIQHICGASGVGVEIHAPDLPIGRGCRAIARAAGEDAPRWAMTGGEDYELLFTAAPDRVPAIQKALEAETGTLCHVVGKIVNKTQGIRVRLASGETVSCEVGSRGWDHFARS